MKTEAHSEPRLQAPGAGLPYFQRLVAKHIALPRYWKKTSWDQATAFFQAEGEKISKLARSIDANSQMIRKLVNPIQGLEDSSRYWSVAMALEHLVITGRGMLSIILDLTSEKQSGVKIDIAKVKPLGGKPPAEVLSLFENFQQEYIGRVKNEAKNRVSKLTHEHPWFGDLTAHQWHGLAAIHQRTHRLQVQAIISNLRVTQSGRQKS